LHEPGCRSGISGDAARQILGHCRPGAGLRSHADFVRARHRRASGMRSRHASPSSDQGPARDAANTARHRSQRDLRAFCAAGADADPGAECGTHRAALPLRPREPDRQVTFMYLRWSTLTDVPKTTLDEPNRPQGALLHNLAKTFEQQNLADVVLYGGQYRDVLRPVVERALCGFVGGTPDQTNPRSCSGGEANIPTAIITHSLAGYMLMDAMNDIYQPPANETVPAERSAAIKVGHYLDQIFLLANQLKMLDLSTRTSEEQSSQVVKRFRATWNAIHAMRQRTEREPSSRQVLAISDPNDILSWEVTKSEFEVPGITVANIYLGTAGEIFGLSSVPIWRLAASPVAAHLNNLQDDDVMDIIACGMTGSTINRCTQ